MTDCVALVVAAGRGARAELAGMAPKQYRDLGGAPVLRYSLAAFAAHPRIDAVRAVIHPDDVDLYLRAAAGLDLLPPVFGGATRQDSSRLGLESLIALKPTRVLIHDGARPLVAPEIVDRTLDALTRAPAAIAAVPVVDTLKRAGAGDLVTATVARDGLWRAQTPQAFRFDDILAAHRATIGAGLSDDAAVAERHGLPVALAMGAEDNVKITTPEDFRLAARLGAYATTETYVGHGYDVHRFGPGDHVMLCGVRVAHDHGLVGHSDADVGLHALTDAILGALGAGDIGQHFPPSDPRWRNADSALFVRHAAKLAGDAGGSVRHIDITIVGEAPRVSPHRAAMVERLSVLLELPRERCSVKATTTEQLGFTGRGEGLAAYATATLRLPLR